MNTIKSSNTNFKDSRKKQITKYAKYALFALLAFLLVIAFFKFSKINSENLFNKKAEIVSESFVKTNNCCVVSKKNDEHKKDSNKENSIKTEQININIKKNDLKTESYVQDMNPQSGLTDVEGTPFKLIGSFIVNVFVYIVRVLVNLCVITIVTVVQTLVSVGSGTLGVLSVEAVLFNKMRLLNIDFFGAALQGGGTLTLYSVVAIWFKALLTVTLIIQIFVLMYSAIKGIIRIINISEYVDKKSKRKDISTILFNWFKGMVILFGVVFYAAVLIKVNNFFVGILGESIKIDGTSGMTASTMKGMFSLNQLQGIVSLILYFLLSIQALVLFVKYIERMIKVAFLIIISPLIATTYAIDMMGDGESQALKKWTEEITTTVLTQIIHVIVFVLIIATVKLDSGAEFSLAAIFMTILGMNFIFKAEGIVFKLFNMKAPKDSLSSRSQSMYALYLTGKNFAKRNKDNAKDMLKKIKTVRNNPGSSTKTNMQLNEIQNGKNVGTSSVNKDDKEGKKDTQDKETKKDPNKQSTSDDVIDKEKLEDYMPLEEDKKQLDGDETPIVIPIDSEDKDKTRKDFKENDEEENQEVEHENRNKEHLNQIDRSKLESGMTERKKRALRNKKINKIANGTVKKRAIKGAARLGTKVVGAGLGVSIAASFKELAPGDIPKFGVLGYYAASKLTNKKGNGKSKKQKESENNLEQLKDTFAKKHEQKIDASKDTNSAAYKKAEKAYVETSYINALNKASVSKENMDLDSEEGRKNYEEYINSFDKLSEEKTADVIANEVKTAEERLKTYLAENKNKTKEEIDYILNDIKEIVSADVIIDNRGQYEEVNQYLSTLYDAKQFVTQKQFDSITEDTGANYSNVLGRMRQKDKISEVKKAKKDERIIDVDLLLDF